jgi:hypothetical protein
LDAEEAAREPVSFDLFATMLVLLYIVNVLLLTHPLAVLVAVAGVVTLNERMDSAELWRFGADTSPRVGTGGC